MLQKARNAESKSLLREIESALTLINNKRMRQYFQDKLQNLFEKRNAILDNKGTKTGEKDLKSEILAYLRNQGQLQTANVWARNIETSQSSIDELFKILRKRLSGACEGILELHLQDREINSPHFQFVGTNAHLAEQLIAQELVRLGYEISMESAMSKREDFIPYFLTQEGEKAEPKSLKKSIEHTEKSQNTTNEIIDSLILEFEQKLQRIKEKFTRTKKERLQGFNRLALSFKENMRKQRRRLRRR